MALLSSKVMEYKLIRPVDRIANSIYVEGRSSFPKIILASEKRKDPMQRAV
jgi:hypothetical protein